MMAVVRLVAAYIRAIQPGRDRPNLTLRAWASSRSVDVAAADPPQPGQKWHSYPERQRGCDVLPFERA
jgi:hypothetical protein